MLGWLVEVAGIEAVAAGLVVVVVAELVVAAELAVALLEVVVALETLDVVEVDLGGSVLPRSAVEIPPETAAAVTRMTAAANAIWPANGHRFDDCQTSRSHLDMRAIRPALP